jgi:hypothetical protein
VIYPLKIDTQIFLVIFANRVEKAYTLNVPAVPTIATVGHHQVIKRAFFRACARKSNTNHFSSVI